MNKLLLFGGLILLLFFFSPTIFPQVIVDDWYQLKIKVVDAGNNPVSGALIWVKSTDGGALVANAALPKDGFGKNAAFQTDASGYAVLQGVPCCVQFLIFVGRQSALTITYDAILESDALTHTTQRVYFLTSAARNYYATGSGQAIGDIRDLARAPLLFSELNQVLVVRAGGTDNIHLAVYSAPVTAAGELPTQPAQIFPTAVVPQVTGFQPLDWVLNFLAGVGQWVKNVFGVK